MEYSASESQGLFWDVNDVMRELNISKPTAYKVMKESGCLAPIPRRKRVRVSSFIAYLSNKHDEE